MSPTKLETEKALLSFVAHSKNYRQIQEVLRHITSAQYLVFREIALNTLAGNLPLKAHIVRVYVAKSKERLTNLGRGELPKKTLIHMYRLLQMLSALTLQYHELD